MAAIWSAIFFSGDLMKTAICDSRIPLSAKNKLYDYCDRIVLLPPFFALSEPVSAHPDMLIFPIVDEKVIFTHSHYLKECEKAFHGAGFEIIPISEKVSEKYPNDILLNAAQIGNYIFGKKANISASIISYAEKNGLDMVDIKQGYAKCSICTVSENAIISSDTSVFKAAEGLNIEVLKINESGVSLKGYDRGFIGGASGNDGKNVFFCGDINNHPDGEKIIKFCNLHSKNAVSLSDEALYDVGTIFFI